MYFAAMMELAEKHGELASWCYRIGESEPVRAMKLWRAELDIASRREKHFPGYYRVFSDACEAARIRAESKDES